METPQKHKDDQQIPIEEVEPNESREKYQPDAYNTWPDESSTSPAPSSGAASGDGVSAKPQLTLPPNEPSNATSVKPAPQEQQKTITSAPDETAAPREALSPAAQQEPVSAQEQVARQQEAPVPSANVSTSTVPIVVLTKTEADAKPQEISSPKLLSTRDMLASDTPAGQSTQLKTFRMHVVATSAMLCSIIHLKFLH